MTLTLIPAGAFLMGSPDDDKDAEGDEKPQHRVRITRPFYLGVYEVTQAQYEAVMGNNRVKTLRMAEVRRASRDSRRTGIPWRTSPGSMR